MKFTVTKVRKVWAENRTHDHIAGVCTTDGVYHDRTEVVASIGQGNTWVTSGGGREAVIRPVSYCPRAGCIWKPYLTTRADNSLDDNLENLPRC